MIFLTMEVKRLFRNISFALMYALFLLFCLYFSLTIDLAEDIDYRSLIAVIDEDSSPKSLALIEKLNEGTALKADLVPDGAQSKLILDGGYAAVLRIPKGFFEELPKAKMEFSYVENDQISPALIDLITQAFITDAVEKVLEARLVKEFGPEVLEKSAAEYEDLKKETIFDLEVIESVEEGASGLQRKLDRFEIANSSSFLLYVAGLSILFASIALNVSKLNDKALLGALLVRNNSLLKYFWVKKLLDYVLVSLPLLTSTLIVLSRLEFRLPALIYFMAVGLLVNILVYELCEVIAYSLDADYALYLMVFVGIGLSLIGGAFFSLDLLPKALIEISQKTPLGFLKAAFFDSYALKFNFGIMAGFSALTLILILLNYRLLRRKAVYSE